MNKKGKIEDKINDLNSIRAVYHRELDEYEKQYKKQEISKEEFEKHKRRYEKKREKIRHKIHTYEEKLQQIKKDSE